MKIAKKIIVSVLAAAMIVTGCPSHYVKADTAKNRLHFLCKVRQRSLVQQ